MNAERSRYGGGIRFANVFEIITQPFLRASQIPGRVNAERHEVEAFGVQRGDVLFNRSSETADEAGLASVYCDDEPVLFGGFVIRATPNATCDLSAEFAGYALRSRAVRAQISSRAQGAIRANVGQAELATVEVTLPPLEEQRAIAAALNDVDALIAALDALIAKKRDIKQATMQQLLTGKTRLPGFSGAWETRRLGDCATFLRNGAHSRAELDEESPVRNLHYGDIHASTSTFFDAAADEIPRLAPVKARGIDRLTDGDLVFVDASEDTKGVGKAVEVIGCGGVELVAGLHTIAVRFSKSTLADRFKAFLPCTPAFRDQLLRLAAGTKVLATSSRHIASVTLPLPSLAEQRAIAEVLTDLDAELAALDARREKTRLIKQGMMQALLTGQVRLG